MSGVARLCPVPFCGVLTLPLVRILARRILEHVIATRKRRDRATPELPAVCFRAQQTGAKKTRKLKGSSRRAHLTWPESMTLKLLCRLLFKECSSVPYAAEE